jgi:hypothetical protein
MQSILFEDGQSAQYRMWLRRFHVTLDQINATKTRIEEGAAVPIAFLAALSCKNGIERNLKIVMHIIDRRQFFLLRSSSGRGLQR